MVTTTTTALVFLSLAAFADGTPADTAPVEAPAPSAMASGTQTLAPLPNAIADVPPSAPAAAPIPADSEPGFFDEGHVGHYLAWYGAEYVGIVALGALWLSGAADQVEPLPALIGPQISLTRPNQSVLFDARLNDQIGKPYVKEQVPASAVGVAAVGLLLANAGLDLATHRDLHRTHALVLGGAEAVLGAVAVTEVLKLSVGRLRPDFRDRYLRAACGGTIKKPEGLDCSTAPNDGFVVTKKDLLDGMKSFPSGHASTSFALLTFLTLSLGSQYLWNDDDMPAWTQPVCAAGLGLVGAAAAYVAMSRVTDGRHHLEDVAAGAGIGVAAGAGAWLVHFEPSGRARRRGIAVAPVPLEGGAGLAVTGELP